MKRDDFYRCKECKQLFSHEECTLDEVKGYICPNLCEKTYQQPPYELPNQDE